MFIAVGSNAQTNSMVKGVYRTFDEFKAGIPTVVDSFYIDSVPRKKQKWLGTYIITPRYAKNNKRIKEIWGFCDGKQSYIFFQSEFFPLDFTGADISFDAYGIYDASGAVVSAMAFGGIGIGIYVVVASEAAKGERVKYILNLNNGGILTAEKLDLIGRTVQSRKLVLYRGTKKESKEPMLFSINDTIINSFEPGSYLEKIIPPGSNKVSICYGNKFEKCETILFIDLTQYVECFYSGQTNKDEYKFVAVSPAQGEYRSVWSYDVQSRREKKQKKSISKPENE